jgi:hypothetical protein
LSGAPHASPVRHVLSAFSPTVYPGQRLNYARVAERQTRRT